MMDKPELTRLSSGYWHCRFNSNQYVQWPCNQPATVSDAFGWDKKMQVAVANQMGEKL